MIKIIDKRVSESTNKIFGDLNPGTIFRFKNDNNLKNFYLKTKNKETITGVLYTAIPLFDDFRETSFMYESEVIILEAELCILRESK